MRSIVKQKAGSVAPLGLVIARGTRDPEQCPGLTDVAVLFFGPGVSSPTTADHASAWCPGGARGARKIRAERGKECPRRGIDLARAGGLRHLRSTFPDQVCAGDHERFR